MNNLDYIQEIEYRKILSEKGITEKPSNLEITLYNQAKEEFKEKTFKIVTDILNGYHKNSIIKFSQELDGFILKKKNYIEDLQPIKLDFILKNPEYFEETFPVTIPQLNTIIEQLTELRNDLENSSPEIIKESLKHVEKKLKGVFEI
jgi:hypothetical protein